MGVLARVAGVAVAVGLLCTLSLADLAAVRAESPWGAWTTLQLRARKMLFFSGSIELHLHEKGDRRILETRTSAKFLGAELTRERSFTVIDAASGRTLEYRSFSPKRGRHYVFDDGGYTVNKLEPAAGFDAPIDKWTVTSTERYEGPVNVATGKPEALHAYHGMLLELGRVGLERPGDEVTFHVATSKGPRAYVVRVAEVRRTSRGYRDLADGARKVVPIREFRLRIAPQDPDRAEEGFLKMEGETELWVEAATRTLLEIEGKIPKVPGRVTIELDSLG